jgi:hypothetical protein
MTGSAIGNFIEGEAVTSIAQVKVNDLLIEHSPQFDALNLCRITRVADDGSRFYALHVDPEDSRRARLYSTGEFCVWNFQVGQTYILHRAVAPTAAN